MQIVIQSGDEVSPGTLQYRSSNSADAEAEWMALSDGATFDGERCAAVVTLVDPAGNVRKTDRQSTCTGSTSFSLSSSTNGTGAFTVKVSIAPWDKPENAVFSEKTFNVIAAGS